MRKTNKRQSKNIFEVYVPRKDSMFRFYHDLEKYRCSYLEFNSSNDRNGIARSLGINVKPLVEKNYIIPPLSRRHGNSITGIMLRHDTKINSVKKGNGKIFRFLR